MKETEYKQLENLIIKLNAVTGGRAICILNNHIADGYHIRVFGNDCNPIKQGNGVTMETAIENLRYKNMKKILKI